MTLRIAIMSDLHVGSDEHSAGGWLHAAANRAKTGQDMIGGLRSIIRDGELSADYLVCPGDLADQASPSGLIRGWELVQQIRTELGAELAIGATGNHDTDSRGLFSPGEPWKTLRELYPPFPFGSDLHDNTNTEYWANGWSILDLGPVRILNLNSSASHTDEVLAKRGRVTPAIIHDVLERLQQLGSHGMNLLVTHHHPMKLGTINLGDDSHMEGGEVLLEYLLDADVGPWLAVHGHKHVPRIDYFAGGAACIPVVASGSLSAKLWDEASGIAKNQFYLFSVEVDSGLAGLDQLSATCEAYSWIPAIGWEISGKSGGIMSGSGFGWRSPVIDCVQALGDAIDRFDGSWLTRPELVLEEPRYAYLATSDQLKVHAQLRAQGVIIVDDDGRLIQIGRQS
jgi:hypothetical protein